MVSDKIVDGLVCLGIIDGGVGQSEQGTLLTSYVIDRQDALLHGQDRPIQFLCVWISGLVNAFPDESVRLFGLARRGPSEELETLYAWFLPLLRLDTVPKFVQLIKLVQQETGTGFARVRPPRLQLTGKERDDVLALVRSSLKRRPA